MGQKVNPNSLRYGIYRKYNSSWFADKNQYIEWLLADENIRRYIMKKYGRRFDLIGIEILRNNQHLTIHLMSSMAGKLSDPKAKVLSDILNHIMFTYKMKKEDVSVKVLDVKSLNINAQFIANQVAKKIEDRMPFKIVQKMAVRNALRSGLLGIKVQISGRLNGVDIARTESYSRGKIPLNTLRSKLDYAFTEAHTTYGIIGVKVWTYMGKNIGKLNLSRGGDV